MAKNIAYGSFYCQVTDTTDDAARAKIHSAVVRHMSAQNMAPNFMLYPALHSAAAGAEVSELVMNGQRPEKLIVAVNNAPPDSEKGTKDNVRNDFFCADLGKDCYVCGTNNRLEFSYVRPLIKKFYRLTNTNHKQSQFRSLEVLPEHAVLFSIPEERDRLIDEGKLERVKNIRTAIPPVPDVTHVFEVDNFGNVKLYVSKAGRALLKKCAKSQEPLYFAFSSASIENTACFVQYENFDKANVTEAFFDPPLDTNVIALRSSSTLAGGVNVPVLAHVRSDPGRTAPRYYFLEKKMPAVGSPVCLTEKRPKKYVERSLDLSPKR
ncbi:MAG: hypothetical protein WC464_07245 [Bdellovibrionales bacterium]